MTGADVRSARVYAGLRGQDVATELGVSQPTISRWENKTILSIRDAYAMLWAIKVLQQSVAQESDDVA